MAARTRLFVYAFLAVFLAAGFAGVEAWPLTGWRLFSRVRAERVAGLAAVVVDSSGKETAVPFASMPAGYRWGPNVLAIFGSMTEAEQTATCDAWAAGARALGVSVERIRIYRVERLVSQRDDPTPASRTPAYTCGDGSVNPEEAAPHG